MEFPEKVFTRLQKANPQPRIELHYSNSYTLAVAVVLSAQSTDRGVNRITDNLFQHISTPQDMLALGEEKLRQSIKSIGLFNNKARNIMLMAEALVNKHNGQLPSDYQRLKELPGIGSKSANVILNSAFGQPTIAVDTHVFRVSRRLGLCTAKTPLAVERCLSKIVPNQFKLFAHHWLVLHGRYVCVARKPKCQDCSLNDLCPKYGVT